MRKAICGLVLAVLIGGTIEFSGNATFNSNFSGLVGGSPVKRPGLGE